MFLLNYLIIYWCIQLCHKCKVKDIIKSVPKKKIVVIKKKKFNVVLKIELSPIHMKIHLLKIEE
jgi:hypothetical protein